MKPDGECYSGGCEAKASVTITFADGWKGHYCSKCARKIQGV